MLSWKKFGKEEFAERFFIDYRELWKKVTDRLGL